MGNDGDVEQRLAMKYFLNVWMAHSVLLCPYRIAGVSRWSMFSVVMYYFRIY